MNHVWIVEKEWKGTIIPSTFNYITKKLAQQRLEEMKATGLGGKLTVRKYVREGSFKAVRLAGTKAKPKAMPKTNRK